MVAKKKKLSWHYNLRKKSQNQLELVPLKSIVFLSLFLCFLAAGLVLIFKNNLPPKIPLYYGLAKGEEQLALSSYLIIPSAVSFFFLFLNTAITTFLEDDFLRKALVISAFSLCILSTVTTLKIMFLVGSF